MNKKYKRIVNLLEEAMKSEESWRKTWQAQSRLHCNFVSKRPYTGTNQLTTMLSSHMSEFKSHYWVTFNQATETFGKSVKGLTATPAIFFGKGVDEDNDKTYRFSRVYNLFNIDQLGIDPPQIEHRTSSLEDPYELPRSMGITVEEDESFNPCYLPLKDTIRMPAPSQFASDHEFCSTLYHECSHGTGHSKRLNRDLTGKFGDEDYAKEELVAELSAVFLCAELGVKYDLQNHASYLKSWQKAIRSDARYVLTAAGDAQKASQYCISQLNLVRKYEENVA